MERDKKPIKELTKQEFNESFHENMSKRADKSQFVVDKHTFLTVLLQKGIIDISVFMKFT